MTVFVTNHAADRWRERAALYGDEGKKDVAAALAESVEVKDDEPLPIGCRVDGDRYFRHPSGVYFVAEATGIDSLRVVTVVVPGAPRNYLNPKRKVKKAEPEEVKPQPKPKENPEADHHRAMLAELALRGTAERRWQDDATEDELAAKPLDEFAALLEQTKCDVYLAQAMSGRFPKKDRQNRVRWMTVVGVKMATLRRLHKVRKDRDRIKFQRAVGAVIPLTRAVLRELLRYDFSDDAHLSQLLGRLTDAAFPDGMHDRDGNPTGDARETELGMV